MYIKERGKYYMKLQSKKIGVVMTGSFGIFNKTIELLEKIKKEKADILPIMSYNAYSFDTKYGKAKEFIEKIENLTR